MTDDEVVPTFIPGDRLAEAAALAAELHAEQVRKGSGAPYLSHLFAVAAAVMEHGGDEDETIAALLHDAVEDQGGPPTLALIEERFGARVASIVEGCTDADRVPKPPWRARKEAYITKLASASRSVRLVSAADKLHNVTTLRADYRREGDATFARFRGGKEDTLWYYRACADVLSEAGPAAIARRLDEAVGELEEAVGRGERS